MQIKLNDQYYVEGFAYVGEFEGGTEIPDEQWESEVVESDFYAYQYINGVFVLDESKLPPESGDMDEDELNAEKRNEFERYAFKYPWVYLGLSETQKSEIEGWYAALKTAENLADFPEIPEWFAGYKLY